MRLILVPSGSRLPAASGHVWRSLGTSRITQIPKNSRDYSQIQTQGRVCDGRPPHVENGPPADREVHMTSGHLPVVGFNISVIVTVTVLGRLHVNFLNRHMCYKPTMFVLLHRCPLSVLRPLNVFVHGFCRSPVAAQITLSLWCQSPGVLFTSVVDERLGLPSTRTCSKTEKQAGLSPWANLAFNGL